MENNNILTSLLKEKEMIEKQIKEIGNANKKLFARNQNYYKNKEYLERQLQNVCMSIWMVAINDTVDAEDA
jgi:hypothetical protein